MRRCGCSSEDPGWNTDERRKYQRRTTEEGRLRCALGHELANRATVPDRFAQIEPHGAAQPVAVAREQGPIETQTLPLGGSNRGIDIERVERIAGRGLDEKQGGRRDRHDEHNGKRQPPKEIWKHR